MREIENEVEAETRRKTGSIFRGLRKKIGVNAELEVSFIETSPVVGGHVFGEAFPREKLVTLEIFAPDATGRELKNALIHELTHVKHPELLRHCDAFWEKVQEYEYMEVK